MNIFYLGLKSIINSDLNPEIPRTAGEDWYITFGYTSSEDKAMEILVDNSTGDIFVLGYVSNTSLGNKQVLLQKYNESGGLKWETCWSISGEDVHPKSMVFGPSKNIYVGAQSKDASNNMEMHFIKFTSDGDHLMTRSYSIGTAEYLFFGAEVGVDSSGNIYLASHNEISDYNYETMLIKYNSAGVLQWVERWRDGMVSAVSSLAIDDDDNIYLTGFSCCSSYGSYVFLLKYNSDGNMQFERTWRNNKENDIGAGICVSPDNNYVYITATANAANDGTNGDFALLKYSTSGTFIWDRIKNVGGTDYPDQIAFDANGNILFTGFVQDGASSSKDICWLNYSSMGTFHSCKFWGGSNSDEGIDIFIDSSSNLFLAGTTKSYGSGDYDLLILKNPTDEGRAVAGGGIPGYLSGFLLAFGIFTIAIIFYRIRKFRLNS